MRLQNTVQIGISYSIGAEQHEMLAQQPFVI